MMIYLCYYKDKGLSFISDTDGEPLEMIVEVIYTLILKQKRGIFRKIFNTIYSTSMHCQMRKG